MRACHSQRSSSGTINVLLYRMAEAINKHATDIIGLARPLTAEPHLVADFITGKSKAAKLNLVDQSVQTASSYLQVGQIGEGEPIADLSDESVAHRVEAAIADSKGEAFLFRPKFSESKL
jgi:hypothetical protein